MANACWLTFCLTVPCVPVTVLMPAVCVQIYAWFGHSDGRCYCYQW